MIDWHILTGEYPPQPGGVSDYTRLVARGLAEAGDVVHVWAAPCKGLETHDAGVEVHRLPDHFGLRSLSLLSRSLNQAKRPHRILVQYVPHAFGWKALNIPFCLWLWSRRHVGSIWVMFHEVHFPISREQSARHRLLGRATRFMAKLVARAAERLFVSIPGWEKILKRLAPDSAPVIWLPVPASIPPIEDAKGIAMVRARYAPPGVDFVIGHFGTYAPHIAMPLKTLLPALLRGHATRAALLLGRGGEALRDELVGLYPELNGKLYAAGSLPADDLSMHLSACDVMIQPFGDGVSCRRTSVMNALAHGLPIVTTSGALTESVWAESEAVLLAPAEDVNALTQATEHLLANAEERRRLSFAAVKLYRERFDAGHTIAALRNAGKKLPDVRDDSNRH
jgi:glycosyltransferase involved in cell wall biosynthesis